jgi:hypothetical protein
MLSRIHDKLGTAGFVISIVALVVALTGGAYAATKGLSPQVKKQITKESKKFSKKFSKQFAVPGPQGAKGDTGAAGANGTNGTNGTSGTNGATGEAGACSGENPECTLPSGATLIGAWSASGGEEDTALAPISFNLRVSPAPTALFPSKVAGFTLAKTLEDGGLSSEWFGPKPNLSSIEDVEEDAAAYEEACPGEVDNPSAAGGFLCIYVGQLSGSAEIPTSESEGANEYGIVLGGRMGVGGGSVRGSWAVTAE